MFINPHTAINEGWVTGIKNPDVQIQPNAIDFTLDTLYSIDRTKTFVIREYDKKVRTGVRLYPGINPTGLPVSMRTDDTPFWKLNEGECYDGMSDVYVNMPDNVAAYTIIRSTFNRNGIFLTSGLYDSGYSGHLGFILHNRSSDSFIGEGTRVGQLIFVESPSAGSYTGQYNHNQGTHVSEK